EVVAAHALGVDPAGRHAVEGDAVPAPLHRERPGERAHARPRSRRVGHAGDAALGAEDDRDDPAAVRDHPALRDRLGEEPGRVEVQAPHRPPAAGRDVLGRGGELAAGVVHEAVDPAEARHALLDQPGAHLRLADVAREHDAGVSDEASGLLQRLGPAAGDHHAETVAVKGDRGRAADAGPAPRDDRGALHALNLPELGGLLSPSTGRARIIRGEPGRCAIRCLLLDATMRPTSLVTRERAVSLVVCGQAQVIADDPDVVYRSQHLRVALPVILQVPAYVELRPIVKRNVVRRVLFCRDNWRCAYCGREGGPRDLTMDHVKPLSRGGAHSWDNVVSACRRCNHRKGNRLPFEAGMYPRNVPKAPDMVQVAWAGRLTHPLQREYVAAWHKVPEAVL